MAAPEPDPGWPAGFRSPPLDWRSVGILRPLLALLGALIAPAVLAWGLLLVAGLPGLSGSTGLRAHLLTVLVPLVGAPFVAFFFLPLLWPLVLVAATTGWAGAASAAALALAIGMPALHWLLHGDVTTEAARMIPHIGVALMLQGLTGWALFWAMMRVRMGLPLR